jgi:MoaA/NifB/PqqE/SkfB family radical SAM enzyme
MFTEGVYLSQVWMGSQIPQKFLPSKIRPLTAHIKFTENCQAKCVSCDYWKSRWEDSMDTARAIRLVNEVGEAGIRNLRFTGGEPFLRRDFFEILRQSHAASSAMFELSRLTHRPPSGDKAALEAAVQS